MFLIIGVAIYCRSLYAHWIPAYVLLPCRMDAISFGLLIAWLNKNYSLETLVNKQQTKILLAIGAVAISCGLLFYFYRDLGIVRNSLFAFVFACLIVLALGKPGSLLNRMLSNQLLGWIGKISYSLYLFHYLILGIVKNIFARYMETGSSVYFFATGIVALGCSVLFSWLVYQYLEKPAVNIGKKYSYS